TRGQQIAVSNDFGETFTLTQLDNFAFQEPKVVSGDGSRAYVIRGNGREIWRFGGGESDVASGLSGDRDAAVELQYLGSGTWRVLSMVGEISPN
ncbi:MAG: hypothetical protein AAGG01_12390, partial [Planctomycetota bacterium]